MHPFGLHTFHQCHWFAWKLFISRLCIGDFTWFFAVAPPTLETSGKFHDSRVRSPDICGFASATLHSGCGCVDIDRSPYLTLPYLTLPYLTLPYLTGKACYRLALRPPVGPMCIPELTVRLLKPLGVFSRLQEWAPMFLSYFTWK